MLITSEFDQGDRPQLEVLRNNLDDAQDQLRRATLRLERAQRRVRNLEVAAQSWKFLVAQYERATDSGEARAPVEIQL
jgi:flagellar biosynthesis chaperone FliJ